MADVFYNIDNSNVTVIENRDLDRIAKLLQDYTKDTEEAYLKTSGARTFFKYIMPSTIYWFQFLVPLIIVTLFFRLLNYWGFNLELNIYLVAGLIVMLCQLIIFLYSFRRYRKLERNNNIISLSISQKRLSQVISFASQTLEHQPLTDIRKFEFKLLLKDAEEMLLKCKEVTKE